MDLRDQGLRFLREHKITHSTCGYGDPNGVVMNIGRSSCAGFDRTRIPVRYYYVNFLRTQERPRSRDTRSASFCRDVHDYGGMFQTLVDDVSTSAAADSLWNRVQVPKIGKKVRSLVVATTWGE